MATISETELQKRLRALEKANLQSGGTTTSASTIERVGDQYQYTSDYIYIAYASTVSGATNGIVSNQSDVTGFQYTPFDSTGTLLSYRGIYKSKSIYASGDPTDYVWEDIASISDFAVSERQYTVSSELLAFLGTPTDPKSGVTWIELASGADIPSEAIWLAERYSIGGVASDWSITPLQNTGAFFIIASGTIDGQNMPALGDTQWATNAMAAVSAFTGKAYSNQKELGYGSVVTVNYINQPNGNDDSKLSGLFEQGESADSWVSPGTFIDGDLMVDGTIRAPAIAANAITADKIGANEVTADKVKVDGSIEITAEDGGNIRAGLPAILPDNLDDLTAQGFWLGMKNDLGYFIVGGKDQHIQWDGSAISLKGKFLTSENIISIDGSSVSTQSFRVANADVIDGTYGEITNGIRGSSPFEGWILGNADQDLTYEFQYKISNSQVGKHFFISVYPHIPETTLYELSDYEVSISLIDPGAEISFYEDQSGSGSRMYSDADSGASPPVSEDTTARYADNSDGRPVKGSGVSRHMYRATLEDISYQKMGKSVTFDNEQTVFFKVHQKDNPLSAYNTGWQTMKLEAYASGEEEYWSVSTDSSGVTHTFDNTYESIQNVQITPGANSAVWFTDLGNTSVKIHSNAASTCHVRAIGY